MGKLGESNLVNINMDYWFLRDSGVFALTAIYMVGLAYKEDILIKTGERQKYER